MAGQTFDGIAKLVATTSRRTALRLAAGGLLGALLALPDAAAARCLALGKPCKGNAQCCTKRCVKNGPCTKNGKPTGKCRCRCPEGRAPCAGKCCPAGEVCTNGTCQPGEPAGCRFAGACEQVFGASKCCPGPDGLDFCFASEDGDPCPATCSGYDCPCRNDADCPAFDDGEGSTEPAFCCKTCAYRDDPEFGTCFPQSQTQECTRCGQTPTPCGSDGLSACYPDEKCCPNGDGSSGICCPDGNACSTSPTSGQPCCKEPNCLGVGEYRGEDESCCCGIYDSTSSGGGQVCCTREIGQSCTSTAECCPDFQGDTVCRNNVCMLPGGTGSDADCPPSRPTWCPPALVDGQMRPGFCANLKTSSYNCGACRNQCIVGTHCDNGFCVH